MKLLYIRFAAMAALISLLAPAAASAQQSANVAVVVNGQQMTFDQPPVERAGRVFVPLRGVFERLGASVVYQNGQINATGNGRNISLTIGSTQATVNGQPQMLDVAPFVIGSRTLVPLRFVAQSLGAGVDWNDQTSTVTITGGGTVNTQQPGYGQRPGYGQQPNPSFGLSNRRPDRMSTNQRPAIHADFSEPVRGNSLRVLIDGRDVSSRVYSNQSGFDITAPFALSYGPHQITVTGTTRVGASFSTGWRFTIAPPGSTM